MASTAKYVQNLPAMFAALLRGLHLGRSRRRTGGCKLWQNASTAAALILPTGTNAQVLPSSWLLAPLSMLLVTTHTPCLRHVLAAQPRFCGTPCLISCQKEGQWRLSWRLRASSSRLTGQMLNEQRLDHKSMSTNVRLLPSSAFVSPRVLQLILSIQVCLRLWFHVDLYALTSSISVSRAWPKLQRLMSCGEHLGLFVQTP